MADTTRKRNICEELREQLNKLDILRKSCGSLLLREGIESDAAKKTIGKFDTLAEELHDAVVLYRQPFNERLNGIEWKIKNKKDLTKWECRVLYEIDWYSEFYEHEEDLRREDIEVRRSDKEKKQDLALAFDTTPNRISVTEEEAISGDIRYHYGLLDLSKLTSIDTELTMPKEVGGDLFLGDLKSIDTKCIMPEKVGGGLYLDNLRSIDTKCTMPKEVGGILSLRGLTSIKTKFTLPEVVGGPLNFLNLESIDTDLTMPEVVGGDLYLNNLTSTQGITNWPVKIIGTVHVNQALPDNEKAALEKRYPGKIRQV